MGRKLNVIHDPLPIFRNVVVNGATYRRRLDHGDKIICKICGGEFTLGEDESFIEKGTQIPYIQCPHCERLVMAAKYIKV